MILAAMLLAALQFSGYPGSGAPGGPVAAAPSRDAAEAHAFLAGVYAGYARRGGPGVDLRHPARLFEPGLAAAIARRAGRLDFDPFCAGQDWDPFVARIDPVAVTGRNATATVRFVNGRPVTIRFELVRTPAGWRIYDMRGTDLPGLRAMAMRSGGRPAPRRRACVGDDCVD